MGLRAGLSSLDFLCVWILQGLLTLELPLELERGFVGAAVGSGWESFSAKQRG